MFVIYGTNDNDDDNNTQMAKRKNQPLPGEEN
jgi:hypothetical protein